MHRMLLAGFLLISTALCGQKVFYKGQVLDSASRAGIPYAATIGIPGSQQVFTTNEGYFQFSTSQPPPFLISITCPGYRSVEKMAYSDSFVVWLSPLSGLLSQVVVSASRYREGLLSAPADVEKVSGQSLKQPPSLNFYEALQNIKGIDLVSSSLLYRQVNMRGFNSLPNQRFLQLIDGMDNQPPGLNFPAGNLFGVSDLDVESIEIIPGASSALYGPVAFNGLLSIQTKNPFQSQGLTVKFTSGINHINDVYGSAGAVYDLAARYAGQFGDKFAFKINAAYTSGKDWYAYNFTDVDAQAPVTARGKDNPARNALNVYGDEIVKTIPGIGRVSRTGYEENALTDPDASNLKIAANLRYKISTSSELSYEYTIGKATAIQTGSSRVQLKDFTLSRHSLELKGARYFVRAYAVKENSGKTYDTRRLAQAINLTWVRDLNGNIVSPGDANNTWFQRYEEAFKGNIATVGSGNHVSARAFADSGRLLPSSEAFNTTLNKIARTQGNAGAAVIARSAFYHTDLQYDFSGIINFVSLLAGGNVRVYEMSSNGTLYDDTNKHLFIYEGGLFLQATKQLFHQKLKITVAGRYDKHENFTGRFTPKIAGSYMIRPNHYFRLSWQEGFRNPVPTEQFIKNNVGALTILGGAPSNSKGLNVYENSFTAASVNSFSAAVNAAIASGTPFNQAVADNKSLLVKSNLNYIRPEKMQSFEAGYKGMFTPHLFIDAGYYFSIYRDFVLTNIVIRPSSSITGSNGAINDEAALDILNGKSQSYNVFTNEPAKVYSQGATLGITWSPPKYLTVSLNAKWASLSTGQANPANIPAFNTPSYRVNLSASHNQVLKNTSLSVTCRWQSGFDWRSALSSNLPGRISPGFVMDAVAAYRFSRQHTILTIGATNLFNRYTYQAYGSSSVGGLYYLSLLFDLPDTKSK